MSLRFFADHCISNSIIRTLHEAEYVAFKEEDDTITIITAIDKTQ